MYWLSPAKAGFGRPWKQAQEKCKSEGAHLAIVNNPDSFEAIKKFMEYYSRYWLGASDIGSPGKWYWIDGKGNKEYFDVSNFTKWSTRFNEPKTVSTYMTMSRTDGWRALDASSFYACQIFNRSKSDGGAAEPHPHPLPPRPSPTFTNTQEVTKKISIPFFDSIFMDPMANQRQSNGQLLLLTQKIILIFFPLNSIFS